MNMLVSQLMLHYINTGKKVKYHFSTIKRASICFDENLVLYLKKKNLSHFSSKS